MKVLGREPAAWLAFIAVGVEFAVAYGVHLSEAQQAGINAVATLAMGLFIAISVARDQAIPVAAGLLVAVLQLAVSFGAHLDQKGIALAGSLLTAGLALWLHGKVTAPIAADGSSVPRQTLKTP